MTPALKRLIRPAVLPCLHTWQRIHDYVLREWREYCEYRERRKILRDGTVILKDIHGMRFVLYPFDRPNMFRLIRRGADVVEFEAIPRMVQPGSTALDIGANAGIYAVLLSRLCGPAGRVWAFEPVPDTYWRLRETLALNRCENVIPVRGAVYEKGGTVRMNLFEPEFAEWNSIGRPVMYTESHEPVSPSRSVEVSAYTLDEFCEAQQIERINFMKVDVEGFEASVFRGAERLLRERRVDYICFEISKDPLRGAGINSRQVFEALETHGYNAYRFDGKTRKFQGPIRDTSESWMNFFASWKDLSNFPRPGVRVTTHKEDTTVSLSSK